MAVAAGLAYAWLWQRQPFENEVRWFEHLRGYGEAIYLRPAWRAVLERADALSNLAAPQTLLCWLSALCAGLATLLFGLGAPRLSPAASARGASLVLATCPAVLCAATAAQPFALVLALAAVAIYLATFVGQRGGWFAVALAGAVAGGAYAFEATGLLVVAWLLPLVYWRARRARLRPRAALALAALTGLTFAAVVGWLCARDLTPTPATEVRWAAGNEVHARDAVHLLQIAGKESLRAFLPAALVVLWWAGRLRGQLARLTVFAALVGSVATAWMRGIRPMEGMLQISLALPASLVVVHHLRGRGRALVVAVGALLGGTKLVALAGDGHARAFYEGLRTVVPTGDPVVLSSGSADDHVACALWLPAATVTRVGDLVLLAKDRPDTLRPLVEQHLRRALADGRRVFLTSDAEDVLRRPVDYDRFPTAAVLLHTVLHDFRIVQREAAGFRAKELLLPP